MSNHAFIRDMTHSECVLRVFYSARLDIGDLHVCVCVLCACVCVFACVGVCVARMYICLVVLCC